MQLTECKLLLTIVNTHKPEFSVALGLVEMEQYISTYPYLLAALPPGQFLSNLMICICSIIGNLIKATGKTWVLSGTFMTNRLKLKVLAYDQQVIKKHEPEAAPGCTDKKTGNTQYLSEIHNVFKTPDNITSTFLNPPAGLQSHDLMWTLVVAQKALLQPDFKGQCKMQLCKEEYQLTDSDHKGKAQELEQSIPP
ncbi:hypothetical protein CPB97_005091 [Podila verticillata]|nr:hypothetical protein CPB97_005091 [Podila verticillata]